MKKLIRLLVMASIRHSDDFYRQEAFRVGLDPTDMTTEQMCFFIASVKAIEADAIIYSARYQKPIDVATILQSMPNVQLVEK